MKPILIALIVLRITTAPATIRLWDERGEPLAMQWRTDGTVAVERLPGSIGIQTHDEDCGVVKFRMEGGGRWWSARVECGNGMRYLDLSRHGSKNQSTELSTR